MTTLMTWQLIPAKPKLRLCGDALKLSYSMKEHLLKLWAGSIERLFSRLSYLVRKRGFYLLGLSIDLNVFMLGALGVLRIVIYEGMLMELGNIHRLTKFFKLVIHNLYMYIFNDVVILCLNIMLSTIVHYISNV